MQIPFLSLHDVTSMHGEEIREAAKRVIDSGWYLQGKENELFEQHYAEENIENIEKVIYIFVYVIFFS